MKSSNDKLVKDESKKKKPKKIEGYKYYPVKDDIYTQGIKAEEIDPEDISKNKSINEKYLGRNEKDFNDDVSGDDLDIPGSELDDEMEKVGSEDEENNYYSLGGDNNL